MNEIAVRERPIIFADWEVRAVLDGRKTQFRRPVKPQPPSWVNRFERDGEWFISRGSKDRDDLGPMIGAAHCPFGQPGDRLWVKEKLICDAVGNWRWSADEAHIFLISRDTTDMVDWAEKKKNKTCTSLHMPRWASRITLEVTGVMVERVKEITEDAAGHGGEGCLPLVEDDGSVTCGRRKTVFRNLWDALYVKRGLGWDANPYVWLVEFKRVTL